MSERRQLSLNFFIYPGGHHEAAWRHRGSAAHRILDVTYYQELAQRAEAHKFDAVFFADGPAPSDNVRYTQRFRLEPVTLLTAIASATKRIGLIATASTTYTEPYNLARLFASLDHISGGRAGWNIVTTSTPQAAQNFGLPEHPPHHGRYARGNISMSSRVFGTAGKTTRSSTTPSRVFSPTLARSTRSTTPENIFACAGRSTSRGRRKGPTGLRPGRLVRRRSGLCGVFRRGDLHRASDTGECPGILRRHQTSGARLRPQSRSDQDSSRHQPLHRQHASRGQSVAGRI